MAQISDRETNFLDTIVYKGERFNEESVLDLCTLFKPTETFQYTHFSSCHQYGVKRGFIKGEALRLLRTNSSKTLFQENIKNFKSRLLERGYPEDFIRRTLSEVTFENRNLALQQKQREQKKILPFVTKYHPAVPNLKPELMNNWHLIRQQPLLREIYRDPPLISYKTGRSLKDILYSCELNYKEAKTCARESRRLVTLYLHNTNCTRLLRVCHVDFEPAISMLAVYAPNA